MILTKRHAAEKDDNVLPMYLEDTENSIALLMCTADDVPSEDSDPQSVNGGVGAKSAEERAVPHADLLRMRPIVGMTALGLSCVMQLMKDVGAVRGTQPSLSTSSKASRAFYARVEASTATNGWAFNKDALLQAVQAAETESGAATVFDGVSTARW